MIFGQRKVVEEEKVLHTSKGDLYGTLTTVSNKKAPVVLIIPGSGPTDRNGNNQYQENNSLKMLADSLQAHGIASLRYDKRGIGASKKAMPGEDSLSFDYYINDAADWLAFLKKDKRFSRIILLGHSEGSLVGMIAAQKVRTAAFISVNGAGMPADKLLRLQLKDKVPPDIYDVCNRFLDTLAAGKPVHNSDKKLDNIFRASVQPYLISWFRHDPAKEIAALKMPVLVIQGTTDIQVDTANATMLAAAGSDIRKIFVDHMNHIMKYSEADVKQNVETYSMKDLPLHPAFVKEIVSFIKSVK
ncbi:alpha/beta hydrolase [Chitinophagaceae bacterium MMS25-I14]